MPRPYPRDVDPNLPNRVVNSKEFREREDARFRRRAAALDAAAKARPGGTAQEIKALAAKLEESLD